MNNFSGTYKPPVKKEDEAAKCEKCQSTWFEQFVVKQFKAIHSAIIGQFVPPAGAYEFVILRCIKCGEKYQPNVLITAQDRGTKLYYDFLEELETEEEKVKKTESETEKK